MANTTSAKEGDPQDRTPHCSQQGAPFARPHFIRKVEEAIATGDVAVAAEALKAAQPEIQRAATKGILHSNTASRKVSRLASRVKALSA